MHCSKCVYRLSEWWYNGTANGIRYSWNWVIWETENFYDQSDDRYIDQSSSGESSESDTDDDAIRPGDIIWDLHRDILAE